MRTRILDQLHVSAGTMLTDYWRADGSYCHPESYTADWVNGSYSHMVDAGTRKTDEIRTRYLEHSRSEIQSFECDLYNTCYSAICGNSTTYHMYGRLGLSYIIRGNPWILDSSEINLKLIEAFRFFESGCVDQETLLANFAWELPDVRSLWPAFRDLIKLKRRPGKPKHPDRTEKTVANAYLAYNFGVVPLVGDLVRIYDRLRTLNDHIEWLRKNSGQITKVEFKTGLSQPTSSTLPYLPSTPPSPYGFWRNITELRAGMKAWALVTYDVSALTDLQLKTKTLLRSFGLNNPAAIVWEAIPYSFVVDWVSNVGDLIEKLEVPVKLPCVFHDCGYGVWVESVIEDHFATWGKSFPIRRTRTRYYSRRPGLPIGISGLSLETPTAKQLTLGLALLAQKF